MERRTRRRMGREREERRMGREREERRMGRRDGGGRERREG